MYGANAYGQSPLMSNRWFTVVSTAITKSLQYIVTAALTVQKSMQYIVVAPALVQLSMQYVVALTSKTLFTNKVPSAGSWRSARPEDPSEFTDPS